MFKITKTTHREVETLESQLSFRQAKHLLKGLHRIKRSEAVKRGKIAVSKIVQTSIDSASFSVVKEVDDVYVAIIYLVEQEN